MKSPTLKLGTISKRDLTRLRGRAHPFPWYQLTDITKLEEDRYFSCPVYKFCLTHAARERWKGFTCRFCMNYKKET